MKILFHIAWHNITRNLRRSIVTIALSSVCVALIMFMIGFQDGQHNKMIKDSVEIYPGWIQIIGKGYLDYPDYDHALYNAETIIQKISTNKQVDAYTPRFESFALLAGQKDSVGAMVVGIDPDTESNLSRIHKGLSFGRYLTPQDTNSIYIGEELAKRLEVKLGDEITLVSTAIDYSMAADVLKIIGVFKTKLYEFDSSMAFINRAYMNQIFLSDGIVTHIIVKPKNTHHYMALAKQLRNSVTTKTDEVITWKESLKSLRQGLELDTAFGILALFILVMVVFFVIMIFSLISIFQRTKEIGIMKAIGTTPKEVFYILMTEALILAFLSLFIGSVIGISLLLYFHFHLLVITGMDEAMQKYGVFDPTFPADVTPFAIWMGIIGVFIINILGVIYPVFKMNTLKPIDAIYGRGTV